MFSRSRRDSGISMEETSTESGGSNTTRQPPQLVSTSSPSLRGSSGTSCRPVAGAPKRLTSEKGQTFTQTSKPSAFRLPISQPLDLKTSKDRTITLPRIQIPDDVIKIAFPKPYPTTFTTKNAEERIRLKGEDCKARFATALYRAETRSYLYEELETNESAVTVVECLLRKLAAQENALKGLSGEATNSEERVNDKDGEANLERMKHETVEALWTLSL
ncbi:hypothetical protein BDZ45DRAFT_699803 [Acephala macrosclerotiorum]|nr:hypothetical protein BDZ45DRAFT_699803 [Acephala macrosclerotiorum]